MFFLRSLMYIGGTLVALISALPLPWRVRLGWARFLYSLSVKTTGHFPSIWKFVESQNVTYEMGKGEASYQPILQLERVLEYSSVCGISVERMKKLLELSELEQIPDSNLGPYIAKGLFDEETARIVVRISASDPQTW